MEEKTLKLITSLSKTEKIKLQLRFRATIKDFLELIPFLTALAFTYSGVKIYTYYKFFFNLNIYKYLDLSELIKYMISDSITMVNILLILGILFLYIKIPKFEDKWVKWGGGMFISIIILILGIYYVKSDGFAEFFIHYFPILFLFAALIAVRYKNTLVIIVGSFIFVYLIGINYASTEGIDVKFKQSTVGNKIFLDSDTLISTKDYIYIGKTDNFFFFYNLKDSTAQVFKMEYVKKMSIRHDL